MLSLTPLGRLSARASPLLSHNVLSISSYATCAKSPSALVASCVGGIRPVQYFPSPSPSKRNFVTEKSEKEGEHEDRSLLGRYGRALFQAAIKKNALDQVYQDLLAVKTVEEDSVPFRLFVHSPSIPAKEKREVVKGISDKYRFSEISRNFLNVLLENRRLPQLRKIVESFETYYRKHKGEIKCVVTSAKPLGSSQQRDIVGALQRRQGKKAKLIVDYNVNPAIAGGLVVRIDEQVLDFSVTRRIESIKAQLIAPL